MRCFCFLLVVVAVRRRVLLCIVRVVFSFFHFSCRLILFVGCCCLMCVCFVWFVIIRRCLSFVAGWCDLFVVSVVCCFKCVLLTAVCV